MFAKFGIAIVLFLSVFLACGLPVFVVSCLSSDKRADRTGRPRARTLISTVSSSSDGSVTEQERITSVEGDSPTSLYAEPRSNHIVEGRPDATTSDWVREGRTTSPASNSTTDKMDDEQDAECLNLLTQLPVARITSCSSMARGRNHNFQRMTNRINRFPCVSGGDDYGDGNDAAFRPTAARTDVEASTDDHRDSVFTITPPAPLKRTVFQTWFSRCKCFSAGVFLSSGKR